MTKRPVLPILFLAFLPVAARGQAGGENYVMAGPAFGSNETLGGGSVAITGSTGFSNVFGFAFPVARKSAATLWVEPFSLVFASPGGTSATPGQANANSILWTPSARLMIPLAPRITVFGAAGGGGGDFHNYALTPYAPPQLKTESAYHGVFSAGGGVDFRIAKRFSIRVDARDYITGRKLGGVNGRNHFLPMLGFVLHY
ncbi:MAG TPA: hypothetical protein VMB03_32320 [Bryobacteraceae bacterium]|nr:hypothetical protein [Bryobacteraceae bacterium]